jgi:hypothetical protein
MTRILTDEFIKPPPSLSNTFSKIRPKIINMKMIVIRFIRCIKLCVESLPQYIPVKTAFNIQRSKPYASITIKR